MEFQWWYVVVGVVLVFVFFGKARGGIVVKRLSAKMQALDHRFEGCRVVAEYSIFKEGSPDHIDIELKQLPIPFGEKLAFILNGELLANVVVKRSKEAKFDYWSDDGVEFPVIKQGDDILIKYQNNHILKGIFHLD